ncbi:MAG: hypothetical protein JO112_11765, partial [Planctomycetes bacterium]|nr:hypothetical protein [Planctomycetota bacterium]
VNQSAVFQQLRWRTFRNAMLGQFRTSWLRVLTILLSSLVVWAGVYLVSISGFHFLRENHITLGGGIVGTLLDLLFVSLGVLLVFSSGIILYSSLFSSAESTFLLSTPATADQVFAYKYQGAIAFSSWAFVLLGSPVLVAYGLSFGAPWYYYGFVALFFLGYVLLPGSVGAFFCLLIVNFLPRRPKQILAVSILLVLTLLGLWIYSLLPRNLGEAGNRDFMQRLLDQLSIARGPLAPNDWMSGGLQAAARGELTQAGYRLALIWSNALMLYLATTWVSARLYRRGFNRVATGGMLRRRYGGHWLDRTLILVVAFLDRQTRLLIVKDFRTFRRDPAQWAQVLIFTILITLYFVNVRRFYQEDFGRPYKNTISLVNLAATALLLCAYTGRFIFPMLSLEGRKFWILGLLPMRRERLLLGKFAFSATWAILVAEFLVVFSDIMLGMPLVVIGLHALTVLVVALGLSGLSVGLGACIPNFRESDPSKIAVGFGGTLNLIVSLFFLMLVIGVMAAPWHLRAAFAGEDFNALETWWLWAGTAAGLALGAVAILVPLRAGARTLRRMEF